MGHVAQIVGGYHSQQKHIGQQGVIFQPIPKAKQKEAVSFLNQNAFVTPIWLLDPEILRRIESSGALERVKTVQSGLLSQLMQSARFTRLVEQEAMDEVGSYRPVDFLADVRGGIWKELSGTGAVKIDAYRRNLQRAYLDLMDERLNGRAPVTDDQRPFFRGELRSLESVLTGAIARTRDRATRMHLEDARDQVASILDPKFPKPAPAPATAANPFARGFEDGSETDEFGGHLLRCWPDYSIDPHRNR